MSGVTETCHEKTHKIEQTNDLNVKTILSLHILSDVDNLPI